MKKLVVFAIFLFLVMSSIDSIAEPIIIGDQTIDLYRLTLEELKQLQKSIKDEISRNHDPSSSEESDVLKATKKYVEEYYKELGISVSWPWFDYDYAQEWEHFTLETRVDYKVEKKSQSDRIHAEVDRVDNEYILSYLKLGKDVVLDERDKYQKNDQSSTIGTSIPESTIDATVESVAEPTPEPTTEPTAEPTPEPTPEPTVEPTPEPTPTPVFQVRDSGNANVRSKSNSESPKVGTAIANATYPLINEENGWYQIILDDGTIGWISGKMGQAIGNSGKSEENVDAGNSSSAETQTETAWMKKGDESEKVEILQKRLIALGYLKGKASGKFDSRLEEAVKAYQKKSGIPVTGTISETDWNAIADVIKEMALRASIVFTSNGHNPNVFKSDGNTFDVRKFKSYSDTKDFYLVLTSKGTWTETGIDAWHVEDIVMHIAGYDCYVKGTYDIRLEGDKFIITNSNYVQSALKYINTNDPKHISNNVESDDNPYLTVPMSMVKDDRKDGSMTELTSRTKKDIAEKEKMHDWAMGQFSIWDGSHKEFVKLVKKNMNDEKSFKHIETNYTEVIDEYTKDNINSILKSAGVKDRVDIGDLFLIMQFSGKNAFNATIKNTAYGIAFYRTNSLKILSIE